MIGLTMKEIKVQPSTYNWKSKRPLHESVFHFIIFVFLDCLFLIILPVNNNIKCKLRQNAEGNPAMD